MNECLLCRVHEIDGGFLIHRCAHFDGWVVKLWECLYDDDFRYHVDRPLRPEWFAEWPAWKVDKYLDGDEYPGGEHWHSGLPEAELDFERQCKAMRQL